MNIFENPTPINNNELIKERLLNLSKELGFIEDQEALAIRNSFEYEKSFAENTDKYIEWLDKSEATINHIADPINYSKAQIGLILTTAMLYKNFGENDAYNDSIDEAINYALNMGFDEVAEKLENLPQ